MAKTNKGKAPISSPFETPTNNSKWSIQYFSSKFKAKFFDSKPKLLIGDSSNGTNNEEALSVSSKLITNDLLLLNSDLKKYNDHMNAHINQAHEKFEELQKSRSNTESEFDELRKSIAKLKLQIPLITNRETPGGPLSRSSTIISTELRLLDSDFTEAREYMYHVNVKINQAYQKFNELQTLPGSEIVSDEQRKEDSAELRKAIVKLKVQIPSHRKIRSNPTRNQWPNINKAMEGMREFFYKETACELTGDSDDLLEDFQVLPEPLRCCLLCFFKFPPVVTIKRTTMIYLWIGQGYISWHLRSRDDSPSEEREELPIEEDAGSKILDEFIAKGFIEPVYENCSLVPRSCRMSRHVRSSLYKEAAEKGFTSLTDHTLDLDCQFRRGDPNGHSCLINVGEADINFEWLGISEIMKHIESLYLGRWQSLATHHIEISDMKILHERKNLKSLVFLSLRGISMITELPEVILELNDMKILDLRACHNLEAIPDNIGLLKNLTHLDISECYFLDRMPKSLALLSNLEVLKGFFIGEFNSNQSCGLHELSSLSKLRKLNIYTSVKDFPRWWDLGVLRTFEGLRKLTISWGGCSLQGETRRRIAEDIPSLQKMRGMPQGDSNATAAALFCLNSPASKGFTLPSKLQKLDLQGFPTRSLPGWLRPEDLPELKKLYIRGGKLYDLGEFRERQGEQCTVEILRFKYLKQLKIEWREVKILFPKLIYLHLEDCPGLAHFPCDKRGVWINEEAIDNHVQLQTYIRINDISSSSMSGSGPTVSQDDSNICPVDE